MEELSKTIDSFASGKAPGNDAIPHEVINRWNGTLLLHLHEHLCLCLEEGAVPRDMYDAKEVTLYKNKGDRSDCNNYRGISLLSVVGKVFVRIAQGRLQNLAERIYPKSQCGFRTGRSTVDMIFSVRQLHAKCRKQIRPLYIAVIELTSRSGLFKKWSKTGVCHGTNTLWHILLPDAVTRIWSTHKGCLITHQNRRKAV